MSKKTPQDITTSKQFTVNEQAFVMGTPDELVVIEGTHGIDELKPEAKNIDKKHKISGGHGDDIIYGGNNDDIIEGNHGDDILYGQDGNDTITDEIGNNIVYGGEGNDKIITGKGIDYVDAGNGDNDVTILGGDNKVYSGSGHDKIVIEGEDGVNIVNAGGGGNNIKVLGKKNTIHSGDGDDTIATGYGEDTIDAGGGNNTINVSGGDNRVYSGAGDDTIVTGKGKNYIDAGNGDNNVRSNGGSNTIITGDGNDTIIINDGYHNTIRAGHGNNVIDANGSNDIYTGDGNDDICTEYGRVYSGKGRDIIRGGSVIDGGEGNDYIITDAHQASIKGGEGNDVIDVGGTDSFVNGGSGHDHIVVEGNRTKIYGGDGHDVIDARFGNNTLAYGGNGNDEIIGGNGNDIIGGNTGKDRLEGNGGEDLLMGGDDNDFLDGGEGNDRLLGENGHDILKGGDGNDLLDGGAGNDFMDGGKGDDKYHIDFNPSVKEEKLIQDVEGADCLYIKDINFDEKGNIPELISIVHDVKKGGYILLKSKNHLGELLVKITPGTVLETVVFESNNQQLEYKLIKNKFVKQKLINKPQQDIVKTFNHILEVPAQSVHSANPERGIEERKQTINAVSNYPHAIDGTNNDDELYGTSGDDVINGHAGDDKIYGGDGDDRIGFGNFGGPAIELGNDFIDGGAGNDYIVDKYGDNTIVDMQGNNKIFVGDGDNQIVTGDGKDFISGGGIIKAGAGDDHIIGHYKVDDKMYGQEGNDALVNTLGDDVMDGGSGDDTFIFSIQSLDQEPQHVSYREEDTIYDVSGTDSIVVSVEFLPDGNVKFFDKIEYDEAKGGKVVFKNYYNSHIINISPGTKIEEIIFKDKQPSSEHKIVYQLVDNAYIKQSGLTYKSIESNSNAESLNSTLSSNKNKKIFGISPASPKGFLKG